MSDPIETKACTRCGTTKSLSEFKLQKRKTGHFPTSWCRLCLNENAKLAMRIHYSDPQNRIEKNARDLRRYNAIKDDPTFREKERSRMREYVARPEVKVATAKRSKAWALANPERSKEKQRKWIAANPERARASWRAYYQTPHGKARHRLQESKRRAMLHGVVCDLTNEQVDRIFDVWDGECAYCADDADTIDHIVPIVHGGPHTMSNVVPACRSCNSKKNDAPLPEHVLARIRSMVLVY